MLMHEHVSSGHLHRVVVTRSDRGWDVRVEKDNAVVRRATYTDWHRVERAVSAVTGPTDLRENYSTNR